MRFRTTPKSFRLIIRQNMVDAAGGVTLFVQEPVGAVDHDRNSREADGVVGPCVSVARADGPLHSRTNTFVYSPTFLCLFSLSLSAAFSVSGSPLPPCIAGFFLLHFEIIYISLICAQSGQETFHTSLI